MVNHSCLFVFFSRGFDTISLCLNREEKLLLQIEVAVQIVYLLSLTVVLFFALRKCKRNVAVFKLLSVSMLTVIPVATKSLRVQLPWL